MKIANIYRVLGSIIAGLVLLTVTGCASTHGSKSSVSSAPSDLIMKSSRDYPTYKRVTFDAMVGTLQQLGYTINERDYDHGQILATLSMQPIDRKEVDVEQLRLRAYIIALSPEETMVRLRLFALKTAMPTSAASKTVDAKFVGLTQSELYQGIFNKLDQGIAIRLGKPMLASK